MKCIRTAVLLHMIPTLFRLPGVILNFLPYFSPKVYVVGTQKNPCNLGGEHLIFEKKIRTGFRYKKYIHNGSQEEKDFFF